jgi:hypothetical protein
MVRGIQTEQWARRSERSADSRLGDRPMERGKGGNQKSTPKGKHGGGGSVYDGRWVK